MKANDQPTQPRLFNDPIVENKRFNDWVRERYELARENNPSLTFDIFRDLIMLQSEVAYRYPGPIEGEREKEVQECIDRIYSQQSARRQRLIQPDLPNFPAEDQEKKEEAKEEKLLPSVPPPRDAAAMLPYDRATHLRIRQGISIDPYDLKGEKTWTEKGKSITVELHRDRPEPYSRAICPMDELICRAIYDCYRRNGYRKPIFVSTNELAREVYCMKPSEKVETNRREEILTRMAYMTGLADFGQPANLKWRCLIIEGQQIKVDTKGVLIQAIRDGVKDGWTIYHAPFLMQQANHMKQICTIPRRLLEAGAARTSKTQVWASFNSWIIQRLHTYQRTIPAEKQNGEKRIWLAEILAETWAHTALPTPKGDGTNYRMALTARRKVITEILDSLKEQKAVKDWKWELRLDAPPDLWPTGTEYPKPKGSLTVAGPFRIQDKTTAVKRNKEDAENGQPKGKKKKS